MALGRVRPTRVYSSAVVARIWRQPGPTHSRPARRPRPSLAGGRRPCAWVAAGPRRRPSAHVASARVSLAWRSSSRTRSRSAPQWDVHAKSRGKCCSVRSPRPHSAPAAAQDRRSVPACRRKLVGNPTEVRIGCTTGRRHPNDADRETAMPVKPGNGRVQFEAWMVLTSWDAGRRAATAHPHR
jgi:hypothetical protein